MANHTILIIDYEPRNVAAASDPLEKVGFKVETAADGVAGLKAFEKLAPALVLCEAMLPKKHGFEVCQEIKKTSLGKRTPVVITTAVYRGRKYRTQALHIYGADEYLEKPFTGEQILEICVRFLGEPPGAAPEAEEHPVAVNQGVAVPPSVSASPTVYESATETPGAFSKIVGDLTEEEIIERLDAILPSEESDAVDEAPVPTETAQIAPAPSDRGIVDPLPPEIPEGFIAIEQPASIPTVEQPVVSEAAAEQPASIPPVEEPVVREAEVEHPAEPEIVDADEPAPEDEKEEPVKAAEGPTLDVNDESADEPAAAEPQTERGGKRRRKKRKKRSTRTRTSKSKKSANRIDEPAEDGVPLHKTASETPSEAATAVPETAEDVSEPSAGESGVPAEVSPGPEPEEISEPKAEEAAPEDEKGEDAVAAPKSEAEELADAVSAAIDQLRTPEEHEAESTATLEQDAEQKATGEEAFEEPEVEAQAAGGPIVDGPAATEEVAESSSDDETDAMAASAKAVTSTENVEEVDAEAPEEAAETPAEPAPRRKTGLWMSVAAALVIGIAATLFFTLRGGDGRATHAVATPKSTPAPMKSSDPTETRDMAHAAFVLDSGSGMDTSEAVVVVPAGVPTLKPEPPLAQPTTPAEDRTAAAETDESPSEPAATKAQKETAAAKTSEPQAETKTDRTETITDTDDAAQIEETETLAPAAAGATVRQAESAPETNVVTEPAGSERLDTQPSLTEPQRTTESEVPTEAEPTPAIENDSAVEAPEPVAPPSSPDAALGDLVPLYQVDDPPTPLDQPRPSYPVRARRLNQQGTVVLNVLVDESGKVTEVEVIRGVAEDLDEAAIRAVRGWTYKPARKDGVNVKVWKPEKVVFKL